MNQEDIDDETSDLLLEKLYATGVVDPAESLNTTFLRMALYTVELRDQVADLKKQMEVTQVQTAIITQRLDDRTKALNDRIDREKRGY